MDQQLTFQTPSDPIALEAQLLAATGLFRQFRIVLAAATQISAGVGVRPPAVRKLFQDAFRAMLTREDVPPAQRSPQLAPKQLSTVQQKLEQLVIQGLCLKLIGAERPSHALVRGCFAVLYSLQAHFAVYPQVLELARDFIARLAAPLSECSQDALPASPVLNGPKVSLVTEAPAGLTGVYLRDIAHRTCDFLL